RRRCVRAAAQAQHPRRDRGCDRRGTRGRAAARRRRCRPRARRGAPVSGTDAWTIATIAGMTVVTVLTRTLFFLPEKPWPLPSWLAAGFRYAPIAALAAVV